MADPANKFKYLKTKATSNLEKILIAILENQGDITINTDAIDLNTDDLESLLQGIAGTQETVSVSRETTTGSVTVGAFSISISNTGAANGTVDGVTIKPGETFEWAAKVGNTLGAIAWVATGTELTILETR